MDITPAMKGGGLENFSSVDEPALRTEVEALCTYQELLERHRRNRNTVELVKEKPEFRWR